MAKQQSRPTTPHRLSSRSSAILPQSPKIHYPIDPDNLPLDNAINASIFTELSDSLGDLDSNLQNLQLVHESLSSFNESFSSFLYGLQMNAWCIEFIEAPSKYNFERMKDTNELEEKIKEAELNLSKLREDLSVNNDKIPIKTSKVTKPMATPRKLAKVTAAPVTVDEDTTYMTNEASFIVQPKTKLPQPNLNQAPRYMRNEIGGVAVSRIPSLSNRGKARVKSVRDNPKPPFR